MAIYVARLAREDLDRLRAVRAQKTALELHPDFYCAGCAERIILAEMRLLGEFAEKYGLLEVASDWRISEETGEIWRDI